MNAVQTKAADKAWAHVKLSGRSTTPLLDRCVIKTRSPMEPDIAFLVHMLAKGLALNEAQAELNKAKP